MSQAAKRGIVMCLSSSLLFGVMALMTKLATGRLSGGAVALARFIGASLCIAVWVLATRRRLRVQRWTPVMMRGVFGGIAVLLYFISIQHIGVGLATLLNFTSPVWTSLLSWAVLKERLRPRTLAGLGLALVGVSLVLLGGRLLAHPVALGYLLLGVGSAAASGVAVTSIRAARKSDGALEIFASFSLFGMLCTAPFGWQVFAPQTATLWWLLAAVVLLSVAAQLLMTHAMRWVDAPTVGVIAQLTVLVSFAGGVGFLGERLTGLAVLGSAVTIAGVLLAVLPSGEREQPPPA